MYSLCLTTFAQHLLVGVSHGFARSPSSFIFIAIRLDYSQAVFTSNFKRDGEFVLLYLLKSHVFDDMRVLLAS